MTNMLKNTKLNKFQVRLSHDAINSGDVQNEIVQCIGGTERLFAVLFFIYLFHSYCPTYRIPSEQKIRCIQGHIIDLMTYTVAFVVIMTKKTQK